MTEKVRKYLSDIKNVIELINRFMDGVNEYDAYNLDLKHRVP
jgi:uncharacterized short protein YbdD (DUF466 family)